MWNTNHALDPSMELDDESGYYAALHVPRDASQEDVDDSFQKIAADFPSERDPESSDLRDQSTESFVHVNEAHQVLRNAQRRQIYDVYGKQGLEAGTELGDVLRDPREVGREFEESRQRTERQYVEDGTVHRGHYLCRIDASELMRGSTAPLFRAVLVESSIAFPLTAKDSVHIKGQATLRGHEGAGNVIMGYKRLLSKVDSIETTAVFGLTTLISASNTRRLDAHSTATLSTTWTSRGGFGIQASSQRQITKATTGTMNWVIGPSSAAGLSVTLQRRGANHILAGKVEVGFITAISARISVPLSESMSVRAQARLGTTGVDLELGANKRWSPEAVAYCGAVVGLQGVLVKLKYIRGGQTFEVPINISQRSDDWRVVVGAYLLPQLTFFAASRLVLRPLAAWSRRWSDHQAQKEQSSEIWASLKSAEIEQSLMASIARRKAAKEAANGGIVILEAVYGVLDSYRQQQPQQQQPQQQQEQASQAQQQQRQGSSSSSGGAPSVVDSSSSSTTAALSSPLPQAADGDSPSTAAAEAEALADTTPKGPPPPWLRVIYAVQYLVESGTLTLYDGASKSALMGFADPTPRVSSGKTLYVAYLHGGSVWEITVSDTAKLQLPAESALPVTDPLKLSYLRAMAESILGVQLNS